jgi:hypothetical protein
MVTASGGVEDSKVSFTEDTEAIVKKELTQHREMIVSVLLVQIVRQEVF